MRTMFDRRSLSGKYAPVTFLLFFGACFASPNKAKTNPAVDAAREVAAPASDASSPSDAHIVLLDAAGDAKGSTSSSPDTDDFAKAAPDTLPSVDTGPAVPLDSGIDAPVPGSDTGGGAQNGENCSVGTDCLQGSCVDGICCDSPCTEACKACRAALTGKADGTCSAVKADTDPKGACAIDSANICGDLGVCDGAGACKKAAVSQVCKAATCTSGYFYATANCDGKGLCPAPTSTPCGNYGCAATGCKTSCTTDTDCALGYVCATATKTCQPPQTCTPKARDCTSTADNDCNGVPDNQEMTYCQCIVGTQQACDEHPGKDGKGICAAGIQTCAASATKTTSAWGACTGAVAPSTEVCTSDLKDENCDGQVNEGCACVNGSSTPCGTCGGTAACSNGVLGVCSKTTSMFYRDADGDGFGWAGESTTLCAAQSGWVANATDCDDGTAALKPGTAICNASVRRACSSAGGASGLTTTSCTQGCYNGVCRTDGTIGVAGKVTCGNPAVGRVTCTTSQGCGESFADGSGVCGGDGTSKLYCDGPNDCPSGFVCCRQSYKLATYSCFEGECPASEPGGTSYTQVCDPLQPSCPNGTTCEGGGELNRPHLCQ